MLGEITANSRVRSEPQIPTASIRTARRRRGRVCAAIGTATPATASVANARPAAGGDALHVVFSAECTPLFDWHSVGLFYSFYASGQHGNITRLLACSEAEQAKYPKANLEIGPTFVHRNMRDDPLVDEKGYPSYNKPYSVMSWLAATKINEDYVLMLDADMVMRQPIEPTSLGARRGNVVSAEYTYLYGTTNGFTERFIPKKLQRRLAQVGGFHIFHKEDLRAISPLWLEYTKKVRAFGHKEPDTFFRESMWLPADTPESTKSVRRKQAMWHSEMYGYVFAAALVGVTHHVRQDVMMYPGNVSGSRSLGLRRTALGPMARHCRLLLPARFPSSPARRSSCTTAATTPSGRPTSTRVRRSGAGNPGLQRVHAPLPLLLTRSAPTPGQ